MQLTTTASSPIRGKPLALARTRTSVLLGLEARPIEVEICCTRGPAFFQLVGLAEATVREARVRVASALARLGVLLDEYAITVNLAPAELRKTGAALDLAIATGVLAALGRLPGAALEPWLFLGELSLDGSLRAIRGVLPQLERAREYGVAGAIVPLDNAREAGLVSGLDIRTAPDLASVCDHFTGVRALPRAPQTEYLPDQSACCGFDLSDVRGQATARRALEIAAAGHHNLLMIGPPGSGKTMLARLLPSILPPLSFDEALEVTAIHSVAGLVEPAQGIVSLRPFRAPHHSVSEAGLVGGGEFPRPGEVSLAHHGVLFLDELGEFRRPALEALRQPLEDGQVCIARARARVWFPARPLVVAAINPCPCGYLGHPRRPCRCTRLARKKYLSRLSGPLIDRLDIHVAVPPLDPGVLADPAPAECSAAVRQRVLMARQRQEERFRRKEASVSINAALSGRELERLVSLDREARRLLEAALRELALSARAYCKILRVALTIADLEQQAEVGVSQVAEAIQGRLLDREPIA